MRRRDFMRFVGGAAVAWPLPVPAQQTATPAINIAVLTDMSGLFATLAGDGSVVAAYMAVEDFGGEVLGRKIQVFFGDHKHKVDVASELSIHWFTEDDVGAIVDMPNSTVALAIQKLAAERNKISITVSGGSSDLTGKDCATTGFHWAYDTYSNTVGMARALVGFGLDTWYFITPDYAFGWSLEENASSAVQAAGGTVIGRSRHPLDTKNFGEFLNAAQESGAKVIALGSAGSDIINAVRQAAETGISPRSQTLVPLLVFISDVHSLGLDVAKGMTFVDGFYWDADTRTREWSKRFYARRGVMPTMAHAGVYSAVRHYLRAVQAAGTDDAKVVAEKMRQLRVDDFFAKGGELRADGRLVHDMYLVQVKPPEESRQPWDYYKVLSIIPGDKAFRPLAEGQCILART
ncbi:MAG TPA: ABC transporter substrate-binding protein [Pseudolabrys sp.]|nr:ABC transporter substrate-binding protein [Pseudolabrys sp.]